MAQAYGQRVWAGDPTTVAEARAKYEANPKSELIPFAVALYSFRTNKKFAAELINLRDELMTCAGDLINGPYRNEKYVYADKADVVSTHLEWMSRQTTVPEKSRRALRNMASELCFYSRWHLSFAIGSMGTHTWYLLTLTMSRTQITEKRYGDALSNLDKVARDAYRIRDINQRLRVYRKLGLLYRKIPDYWISGLFWGIRACFIRGVPLAVRLKSLAALLGIDR